jgi:hypothetical protein
MYGMIKLTERDRLLIADLERFRVMDRDSIAELYFSELKNPIQGANSVLKRLHRDRLIERSNAFMPYVYMPVDSKMKKNSQKILHYLAILSTYKQMCQYKKPKMFIVEDKPTGKKGGIEPDFCAIFNGGVFWGEVQRNQYSEAMIAKKISMYEDFYRDGGWQTMNWQPEGKTIFPTILFITPVRYKIETKLRVVQVADIHELMTKFGPQSVQSKPTVKQPSNFDGIKINIGEK